MSKRMQPWIVYLSAWTATWQQMLRQYLSDRYWGLFKSKQYWSWRTMLLPSSYSTYNTLSYHFQICSYICVWLIFVSTKTYFYIKYSLSVFSIRYSDKLCKVSRKIVSRTGKWRIQLNAVSQISQKTFSNWNFKSGFWMTMLINDWDQAQPISSRVLFSIARIKWNINFHCF